MRISDWSSYVCSSDLWPEPMLPDGALTDGTIAVAGSLLLFILPDGTGRPLLLWKEADRTPWGVIMLFGGGLALAAAITASGLAARTGAVQIGRGACRERRGQVGENWGVDGIIK